MNKALEIGFAKWSFSIDSGARKRVWRKLARYMRADTQFQDALREIRAEQLKYSKPSHPSVVALTFWIEAMSKGMSVSQALNGWIPNQELLLIQAGDLSGHLEKALESVCTAMEAKKKIRSSLISAAMYPGFFGLISLGVLYFFGVFIVPKFSALMKCPWTGPAVALHFVSHLLVAYWWILPLVVVGIISWFVWSLANWNNPIRVVFDRYLPYSLYRVMLGSSWLIAMASLIESGTQIDNALSQMEINAPVWLKIRLRAIGERIRLGNNFGDALHNAGFEFPDREIISDLGVYARQKGFDEAIRMLGREWQEESVERMTALSGVLKNVGMFLVFLVIGLLIFGLMQMEGQLSVCLQSGVH